MIQPGSGHKAEGKRFYPDYLSEIIAVILICLELLIILALIQPPAIGREIDLLKPFQPRPEWYFLWLFELIGYFPGPTAVIGTVIIPVAAALLLLFIPYIDRGEKGRRRATMIFISLLLLFTIFTLLSLR
jgi:quinol-cytochrome oxidoreductase complex cytochrome b subunit